MPGKAREGRDDGARTRRRLAASRLLLPLIFGTYLSISSLSFNFSAPYPLSGRACCVSSAALRLRRVGDRGASGRGRIAPLGPHQRRLQRVHGDRGRATRETLSCREPPNVVGE